MVGFLHESDTVCMVSSGAASTASATALRAALAGPRLPVTASATTQAATIRKTSAEATWVERVPSPTRVGRAR